MAEREAVLKPSASKEGVPEAVWRVLVVEDDPIMLRLTTQVIAAWKLPLDLCTASNGFEGLLRIGEMRPDLVITDLNMPGMNGFQMLESLKRPGSGYESLKVIVISALNAQQIAQGGGLPPDVTFLAKPVHYGELETMVRDWLHTVPAP